MGRARAGQPQRRPLYPHQLPPEGDWNIWLLLGGRGSGKTEAGARYVDAHARGDEVTRQPTAFSAKTG